jgi:hypothetical protein
VACFSLQRGFGLRNTSLERLCLVDSVIRDLQRLRSVADSEKDNGKNFVFQWALQTSHCMQKQSPGILDVDLASDEQHYRDAR